MAILSALPYIYFVCSNLHVRKDFDPFQCLLNIQPMKGMCWVSKAKDVVSESWFVRKNLIFFLLIPYFSITG